MAAFGVFIGRFQPFHSGHQFLINESLAQFERLIIVVGSAGRARSTFNPFTYEERVALIKANLGDDIKRVEFVAVPDVFYDEAYWCELVKAAIKKIAGKNKVTLIGHTKDTSSYYLKEFPEWASVELANFKGLSATPLRWEYLLNGTIDVNGFSGATQKFLQEFKTREVFQWLQAEAQFIKNYQASWSQSPFPPMFVTTDSIVICKQHILLIERKYHPGKGLYALPGGFVEPGEWIKTGLIRELVEETQINLNLAALEQALVQIQVFDYPGRSQIGRVITHVGLFKLKARQLPEVLGSDDAGRAFWLSLEEFFEHGDKLHDDHFQIVQHLWRQGLLK